MLITDERHTAAVVGNDGAQRHFDDTGEMIATIQESGGNDQMVWVHAFDTRVWLDGRLAVYVVDPNRNTPMATGVIAFDSQASAATFTAGSGGEVRTWNELLATWTIE